MFLLHYKHATVPGSRQGPFVLCTHYNVLITLNSQRKNFVLITVLLQPLVLWIWEWDNS